MKVRAVQARVNTRKDDDRADLVGRVVGGRYHVLSKLGGGGTGLVFEALCTQTGKAVALKTLRPGLIRHVDLSTRLRREYEVAKRVLHPGLVRFVGEGMLSDGSPFVAMTLLRGASLAEVLTRCERLATGTVTMLASRVASILHSAHTAGYVHRDVKPEHVYMSRTPQGGLRVHLLDFGVCYSEHADPDEKRREAGRVFGTPRYVSPEQASGELCVDGRADLFGLGLVMFEALTGKVAFAAPSVAKLLLRIVREDAPRASDLVQLDARLDGILGKLLIRDKRERTPTARALSRALLPYAGMRARAELEVLSLLDSLSGAVPTATTMRCTTALAACEHVA